MLFVSRTFKTFILVCNWIKVSLKTVNTLNLKMTSRNEKLFLRSKQKAEILRKDLIIYTVTLVPCFKKVLNTLLHMAQMKDKSVISEIR